MASSVKWLIGAELLVKFSVLMVLLAAPLTALAEGRCPPGQYPIGSSNGVLGCAPIPGGTGGPAQPQAPVPSGRWESRWGAIAEDRDPAPGASMATGASVSQISKRAAVAAALDGCGRRGGRKCEIRLTYHDQCAAIADPPASTSLQAPAKSIVASAEDVEEAKGLAVSECSSVNGGALCQVAYSACSMSEFRPYR